MRVLQIVNALGIRAIYCPYLMPDERPNDAAGWRAFGARLQTAGKPFRDAGLDFGWHNHDFEFKPLADGTVPQKHILDAAPNIGWEIDVAWVIRSNTDPLNRRQDYRRAFSSIPHDLRTNGTLELPIGPGKWLLGNSSGFLARVLEQWQIGTILNLSAGRPVTLLEYEAYSSMARKEMMAIATEIEREMPGTTVAVLHRVGPLVIGDTAVVCAASAPHRSEAFAACRALIDRIKARVPIWKREHGPEGPHWVGWQDARCPTSTAEPTSRR